MFIVEKDPVSYKCGSTAISVLILGNRIYTANLGDCRAVLSTEGTVMNLSLDQNLKRKEEKERLELIGALNMDRVKGRVLITRGFGDADCKLKESKDLEQAPLAKRLEYKSILIEPEIGYYEIDPFQDEFVVLGSDGLFEKMKSRDVVGFVRERIVGKPEYEINPNQIAKELVDEVVKNFGVKDDVTCIIVLFQRCINPS